MEDKITVIRCKFCNGKLSLVYPNTRFTCPSCKQEWNIHWLQEDSAIIISPVSWTEYAKRERNNTLQ
jgi:phage FluMu protein Com